MRSGSILGVAVLVRHESFRLMKRPAWSPQTFQVSILQIAINAYLMCQDYAEVLSAELGLGLRQGMLPWQEVPIKD
jgi:hypothetical protein